MANASKKPIPLLRTEQRQVQDLEKLLGQGVPALIGPAGERIELPGTLVEVLRTAVGFMSRGQTVSLIPDNAAQPSVPGRHLIPQLPTGIGPERSPLQTLSE
jgi:hypothetical protein